ncbi:MAG: hypothetical protein HYV07_32770 [Deltaproteobacteria bacterium]|nr:hypothetical protein [Deltaproteobacteria bacterium]
MKRAGAILVLVIGHSPRATAIGFSGSGSIDYARADDTSTDPRGSLGWGIALQSINAGLIDPRLLDWSLSGAYSSRDDLLVASESSMDRLTYGARGKVLSLLDLGATRAVSGFSTTNGPSQVDSIEASSSYYARTTLAFDPRIPRLGLTVNRLERSTVDLAGERFESIQNVFGLNVMHALGRSVFGASYDAAFGAGTREAVNQQSHATNLNIAVQTSSSVHFSLSQRYFLRLPAPETRSNPRYDDHGIQARAAWRPSLSWSASAGYGYQHVLVGQGELDSERWLHSVDLRGSYRLSPELNANLGAGTSIVSLRQGDARETRATGRADQAASLGLSWAHTFESLLTLGLSGGGSLGLAEQGEDGSVQPAFGVGGGGLIGLAIGPGSASYDATGTTSFRDLRFEQRLQSALDLPVGRSTLRLRAGLSDRLLVAVDTFGRSRDLSGDAEVALVGTWGVGQLRGAIRYGLEKEVDPLSLSLLPETMNIFTRSASLTLGAHPFGIPLMLIAATSMGEAPDRPASVAHSVQGRTGAHLGAFRLVVSDTYTIAEGSGAGRRSVNVVFVRLERTFGVEL